MAKGRMEAMATQVRLPKEVVAGVLLIAVGGFALWQSASLEVGTLRHFGPGMLPRALAVMTLLCGVAVAAFALRRPGLGLSKVNLRALVFLLGGAVAFGFAVRGLGLAVAGPLVVLIVAAADSDVRWRQMPLFAGLLTVFCLALFRYGLSQPIPVAPWLIGY